MINVDSRRPAKHLKEVGRDPRFLPDLANQAGPLGEPIVAAKQAMKMVSEIVDQATLGLFGSVFKEVTKDRKLSETDLGYFFGYALRFYTQMVPLLADARTEVEEVAKDDPIRRTVNSKLDVDARNSIGLRVRWPPEVRTHSRDMTLFFDQKTHLLSFFQFDVDTLNPALRAWYRVSDWTTDPESGIKTVGTRRAIVSPGGIEVPEQPWTVKGEMGIPTWNKKEP